MRVTNHLLLQVSGGGIVRAFPLKFGVLLNSKKISRLSFQSWLPSPGIRPVPLLVCKTPHSWVLAPFRKSITKSTKLTSSWQKKKLQQLSETRGLLPGWKSMPQVTFCFNWRQSFIGLTTWLGLETYKRGMAGKHGDSGSQFAHGTKALVLVFGGQRVANLTPPKIKIASEKWWLEDCFPFEMVAFQGGMLILGVVKNLPWGP